GALRFAAALGPGLESPAIGQLLAVAVGPAVIGAFLEDIDLLRRGVVSEIVAAIVCGPQLARHRMPGEADGVGQTAREEGLSSAVGIESKHGSPAGIGFDAEIAARSGAGVEVAIRTPSKRACRMPAAGRQRDNAFGLARYDDAGSHGIGE